MTKKIQKNSGLTFSEITKAKEVLSRYLVPSPLLQNPWLSEELGCNVYLKLETMQPVGSFKIRGATYKISQLSPAERRRGVICASAGNHAQGVAWGARELGVKATVVMPRGAPLVKIQNTRALGAEVILEGDDYDAAFSFAQKLARKNHKTIVHAFDDHSVMAGQGTVGLEILDQLESVDVVIGSIGGGGLMSGVSTAFKELKPSCWLVGCQSEGAPSMVESIRKGRAVTLKASHTFADGIAVRQASEGMRRILDQNLDKVVAIPDEAIATGVLDLIEKAKIITEGSAAITLAAARHLKKHLKKKNVVLILSGGNIDINLVGKIIERGLIRAGRHSHIRVLISDRPGSLARLTALLAREGVNILQAIHDRSEQTTAIDQTQVDITVETRGPDHTEHVLKVLRGQVDNLEVMG